MGEEIKPDPVPEIPWPDVPRLVFGAGEPRHLNANVEWAQRFGMYGYVEGYARAAKAVFETARDQNPDYFIWPLAFLWRQQLELALKEIISLGRQLQGESRGFPAHHILSKLWEIAKEHMQKCSSLDSPEVRNVESAIVEFDKIDRGGDGFRYPLALDMKSRSLPAAPSQVNLALLHEAMEAVAMFLSCVREEMKTRLDALGDVP